MLTISLFEGRPMFECDRCYSAA